MQHVARTAIASIAAILIAQLFALSESYWAGIATLVIIQSSLKAAWDLSIRQLIGTALGACTGALLFEFWGHSVWVYSAGILLVGLAAVLAGTLNHRLPGNMDRSAYRFAGVTLIVVLLVPHTLPIWVVARDRFCEYAIGIGIGLAVELIWPDSGSKSEEKHV